MYVPSYQAFRQIKIRHIFIMQFGGYFVKFYSRQISGHTVFDCFVNIKANTDISDPALHIAYRNFPDEKGGTKNFIAILLY